MTDLHNLIDPRGVRFRTCEEVRPRLQEACAGHPKVARFHALGTSEAGRPLDAVVLGTGARKVSLIAGAHSDEPVGPETLGTFILHALAQPERFAGLFSEFTFVIVPHINPDGEARNRAWTERWPDAEAYLRHVFREPPGRDLEFGFPNMRPENARVADFLRGRAPFALHMSLHGMAVAEGAMLLIERHWVDRTDDLRNQFVDFIQGAGLPLHDHDRGGEKGFRYIGPGFTTTPEGRAMQEYFRALGDEATAKQFHLSSMEFVRTLGGDPLCLVTEFPLFLIGTRDDDAPPGVPAAYLRLREQIPELKAKLERGESIAGTLDAFGIRPVDLDLLVKLQLFTIALGLSVCGPKNN